MLRTAVGRDWKGKLSPAICAVAIPLALALPWMADLLYGLVVLVWILSGAGVLRGSAPVTGALPSLSKMATSLTNTSARRSSPFASRRIIGSVRDRVRARSSETGPREPIMGSRSRCRSFFCSMRTRIASTESSVDGPVPPFVCLDQSREHIQASALGCPRLRLHERIDPTRVVIVVILYRPNRDLHQIATRSMSSYSLCAPKNLTYTIRYP